MNDASPTVAQALALAHSQGLDRLDAQLLLGHVLARPRAWLIAHDDDALPADAAHRYQGLCDRRAAGEPVAYLLGRREFHGLDLAVTPAVLIPRPDTEVLVDWGLELLSQSLADRPRPRVLDLGTGSGAIALAIAHDCARAAVTATDRSIDALAVARANAQTLGLHVAWLAGDWWDALDPAASFDLVLTNPPYIATGDAHLPALRYEPAVALTSGGDGLDAIRRIVAGARPGRMTPGGHLLMEHGWDQAEAVADLLQSAGFRDVSTRRDLQGHARCTGGRWPGDIR